ncbi:MAG: hypothetical protein CMH54_13530 [Myxococcales bacterium]|nr:hypothetical protein [Myxococcales bacterium]
MRMSLRRACTTRLIYLLSLFVVVSSLGCGGGNGGDSTPDVVEDTGTDQGAGTDQGPLGPVTVAIQADLLEGNAPLTVNFWLDVGDLDMDRLKVTWDFGGGTTSSQVDPVFTFYQVGDYNVSVEVFEIGNPENVATDEVVVRVREPADLEITDVEVRSATDVGPGETVKLGISVKNQGGDVPQDVEISVYLSTDEVLSPDSDILALTHSMGPVDSGDTLVVDPLDVVLPAEIPDGAYFIWVVVDPDEKISETNEENNSLLAPDFLSVSQQAGVKPDLYVTDLNFGQGQSLSSGATLSFSFKISNGGLGDAQSFRFAVYRSTDQELDDSDVEVTSPDNTSIFVHKAGITLPIFRGFTVTEDVPDGDYYLIAHVDPEEDVAETDETNNIIVSDSTFNITQVEPEGKDLALVSFEVPTYSTYLGGGVTLNLVLRNDGTEAISGAVAAAYFSEDQSINPNVDILLDDFVLPVLTPGVEVEQSLVVGISNTVPLFNYYVGVILDPTNAVNELDETNNFGLSSHTVSVEETATVDIRAESCSFDTPTVVAGETMQVDFSIKNVGASNSGGFDTWIVFSENASITVGQVNSGSDLVVHSLAIADLSGGETKELTEEFVVPLALPNGQTTYHVGIIINPNNSAGQDTFSTDNVAVASGTVEVTGAQGGCFADANEPNETTCFSESCDPLAEQATLLGTDPVEGYLCSGDHDWYAIDLGHKDTLQVTLISEPILSLDEIPSNLGIKIYRPDGTIAAEGHLPGNVDQATTYLVGEADAGMYRIEVVADESGAEASYTLSTSLIPPADGVDLMVNQVVVNPVSTFPGGLVGISLELLNLGNVNSGACSVEVYLSEDEELDGTDIDLGVIDVSDVPAEDRLGDLSAIPPWNPMHLDVVLPTIPGGTYHILAKADYEDAIVEADETNNINFSGEIYLNPDLACSDDSYEPNGSFQNASFLPAESAQYPNLTVCPELDDWYAVNLDVGTSILAQATFDSDPVHGAVYIELVAPNGITVIESATSGNSPTVGLPYVFTAGTYFVHVYHSGGGAEPAPFSYNLGISISEPLTTDICVADSYEPNWDFSEATLLGCGSNELTLCKEDKDIYSVYVPADSLVTFTLHHAGALLRLELFDEVGGSVVQAVVGNGSTSLSLTESQVYYLLVRPKTGSIVLQDYDYSIFIDGTSGTDLIVGEVTPYPYSVVQGEDTFLNFTLENQCINSAPSVDFAVYLSADDVFDPGDQEIYYSDIEGGIGSKEVITLSQKVTVPVDSPVGPNHLVIVADPYDQVAESNENNNATPTTVDVVELCLEDAYEPNNNPVQAASIEPGDISNLAICPFELDWYAFDTTAGKQVEVTLAFANDEGDLDVRLYYSGNLQQPVASAVSAQDGEVLTYTTTQSGTYYIRVNGFAGDSNSYDMNLSF